GFWTQLDQKDALTLLDLFGSPATPSIAARPACLDFLYALVEVYSLPTARVPSEQPCGHFLVLFFRQPQPHIQSIATPKSPMSLTGLFNPAWCGGCASYAFLSVRPVRLPLGRRC